MLRRRLVTRPNKLNGMQALGAGDREMRVKFSNVILRDIKDDNFLPLLIFSDEATFSIGKKVNRHNVQILGVENPQEILEHHRDFPKVLYRFFLRKIYVPFFEENTIQD